MVVGVVVGMGLIHKGMCVAMCVCVCVCVCVCFSHTLCKIGICVLCELYHSMQWCHIR